VNIDDLDAANTTMFNLAANSKSRIAQRAERKLNIRQEHQLNQDEIKQQAGYVDREWEMERQKLQAAKPKGLLGNQKTDASKFQFEDDTGEQQALDDEYDQLVDRMETQTGRLLEQAQFQNFMIEKQNQLLTNLTDKVRSPLQLRPC
jgi:arylsulfatase A-like enzyme